MATTRSTRHIDAPPSRVYQALIDPGSVQEWMVPEGMTSFVHHFDPVEGGEFRISLTYDEPTDTGKTDPQTDTFHGRFVELVPNAKVVQTVDFETDDDALRGEMVVTYTLAEVDGATELVGVHENLPPGLDPALNDIGWRMSIDKLATLVEGG